MCSPLAILRIYEPVPCIFPEKVIMMKNQSKAIDMTRGSILRCMLLFTLPIVAGNILQEFYNIFDTLIVGRTLGVVKLAAVGITGSLVFFGLGFTGGISGGCSALTSQRRGAGDTEGLERSIAAHYVIALGEAVVLTALLTLSAKKLLILLHTGSDMLEHSRRYLVIIYAGLPASILYNTLSSILRAMGDSRTPLLFLAFCSVLNIVLDLVCILLLRWDVRGAAIATVFSQLVSGLACLLYTRRRYPELLPSRAAFRHIGPEVAAALKVGIPMGLNMTVTAIGALILARVLNSFGSSAVAGFTVCNKIQHLMETVMYAVSTMVATYTGQNCGARRFDRIRRGIRLINLLSCAYLVLFSALVFVFRRTLIGFFIGDSGPEIMPYVEEYLRWMCASFWLYSFLNVYRGGNIGLGNGKATLLSGFGELTAKGVFTPLLAPVIGFTAICVTGPLGWFLCVMIGFVLFTVRLRKLEKAA